MKRDLIEPFNCPFCNCTPKQLGFKESKERYGVNVDQYTFHCPGCGVDMKELRIGDEMEKETHARLFGKWQLRNKTLGVNIDHLVETLDERSLLLMNLLGKQVELIGILTSFGDEHITDNKFNFESRHKYIISKISELKFINQVYTITSVVFALVILMLVILIKVDIIK